MKFAFHISLLPFFLTVQLLPAVSRITTEHIGKRLAVVVNGNVVTSAVVRDSIKGGEMQVSGGFDEAEAKRLSLAINGAAGK